MYKIKNTKRKINFIKMYVLTSVMMLMPIVVYGQYIIEDISNIGDDGLRPEISDIVPDTDSQIIEDVVATDVTAKVTEITDTTVTEVIVEHKKTFHTIGLLGVLSGAAITMATTAVPLFAVTPTIIKDLMFLNLFGFLVKRKNEKRWGIVFDVDTKLPIPAAKVTLFDSSAKELETTYSDKDGRFGFLVEEGVYKLDVYKKDYEAFVKSDTDDVYGSVYVGDEVNVSGEKVLSINMALRSLNINWKEYANKKVKQYTSTWSLVKKYLFTIFYLVGFSATIVITILNPSVLNIILIVINVIFFVNIYFYKKKDYGTVMTNNEKPVPFAVVNLYDSEGKKDAFAVTDVIGRYYMLANNGKYTIKAVGQPVGSERMELHSDVHVREGIVSKDVIF